MKKLEKIKRKLRKIEIVEIENSYLNFFTPAIVVVIAYFLYNLFFWPWLLFEALISKNKTEISSFINAVIPNLSPYSITTLLEIVILLLSSVAIYYIFVIRLKVKSTDYKKASISSFRIVLALFFVMVFFSLIFRFSFDYNRTFLEIKSLTITKTRVHPIFFFLSLVATILESALFLEIIYRRALIPLFEDRGLSPFFSVLLSAWALFSINIPTYIIISILFPGNLLFIDIVYDFIYILALGIIAGFIYVQTRNLIFPFLFMTLFRIYDFFGPLGFFEVNEIVGLLITILEIISIVVCIVLVFYLFYKLTNKDTAKDWVFGRIDVSHAIKGIIGFFVLTLGLLMIQTLAVRIGHQLTDNIPIYIYPDGRGIYFDYFCFIMVFYVIAFSLPFWLTIKTEYIQDIPT